MKRAFRGFYSVMGEAKKCHTKKRGFVLDLLLGLGYEVTGDGERFPRPEERSPRRNPEEERGALRT